jgi:hypothetical protein
MMSPTAEQLHDATATFTECSRLVHRGRVQAGIQSLMRRWRAIPSVLQMRFLHTEFLTLPADIQAGITDLTRWHKLGGFAAFFALAAILLCFARVL